MAVSTTHPQRLSGPGATAMAASLLALAFVAPLAAQGTASLLDLLTNPKADALPALVLAPSDGVLLAGRPMVPSLPRLTLAPQPGDAVARTPGQRLRGAVPDIIAPPRLPPARALPSVVAERLTPHYPNPDNSDDRKFLESILGAPLPPYMITIEPAINAPKWEDTTARLASLPADAAEAPGFTGDHPWTAPAPLVAIAVGPSDTLDLGEGFDVVPPPPLVPQVLAAVTPDLLALPRVAPEALRPSLPDARIPDDRAFLEGILGVPLPEPYATQALAPQVLTGKDLDQALQVELIRLNCFKGTANGKFGDTSKGALDLFFKTSKMNRATTDRSQAILDQLKTQTDPVCPKPFTVQPVAQQTATPTTPPKTNTPTKATTPAKPAAPAKPATGAKPKTDCKAHPEECIQQ